MAYSIKIMLHTVLFTALFFALSTLSTETKASSIGTVSGPSVTKGKLSSEARAGFAVDDEDARDNRLRTRIHLDYGLTDFYAPRLIVSGDKRNGNDLEFDALTLENRFDIIDRSEYGFDAGFRLTYSYKDGDKKPDSVSVRLIQLIPYEQWEFRFNQDFAHEVGEDSESGLKFEWRMQGTYKLDNGVRVGLDSFNSFGRLNDLSGYSDQSHKVGPIAKGKFPVENLGYEASYLSGVSDSAPDHTFKINLKKTF